VEHKKSYQTFATARTCETNNIIATEHDEHGMQLPTAISLLSIAGK